MRRRLSIATALIFAPLVAFAAEAPTPMPTPAPTPAAPAATTPPAATTNAATPDTAVRGQRWAACASEVAKFCTGIEKGKGKMRACLEGHAADLSDGCKARMAEKRGPNAM